MDSDATEPELSGVAGTETCPHREVHGACRLGRDAAAHMESANQFKEDILIESLYNPLEGEAKSAISEYAYDELKKGSMHEIR